jgi:hypothetical protein
VKFPASILAFASFDNPSDQKEQIVYTYNLQHVIGEKKRELI